LCVVRYATWKFSIVFVAAVVIFIRANAAIHADNIHAPVAKNADFLNIYANAVKDATNIHVSALPKVEAAAEEVVVAHLQIQAAIPFFQIKILLAIQNIFLPI